MSFSLKKKGWKLVLEILGKKTFKEGNVNIVLEITLFCSEASYCTVLYGTALYCTVRRSDEM